MCSIYFLPRPGEPIRGQEASLSDPNLPSVWPKLQYCSSVWGTCSSTLNLNLHFISLLCSKHEFPSFQVSKFPRTTPSPPLSNISKTTYTTRRADRTNYASRKAYVRSRRRSASAAIPTREEEGQNTSKGEFSGCGIDLSWWNRY